MNQLFTNFVVAGVPDEGGGVRVQRVGGLPARHPRGDLHHRLSLPHPCIQVMQILLGNSVQCDPATTE